MTASAQPEPIERLLSKWKVASRTEAQRLVRGGHVRAAGIVLRDPREVVDPRRGPIEIDGKVVGPLTSGSVWIALNKPRGVVSTTKDPEGRKTVMDLVDATDAPGLAPVGRLDQASAGLILLSNDSVLADRILDPATHVPKRYRVKVRGHVSAEKWRRLTEDTLFDEGIELGPMSIELESKGPKSSWLIVTLDEGKNRQIRRRMKDVGHEVEILVRTAIGPLELGDLAPGASRSLSDDEIASLRAATKRTVDERG